MNFAFFKFLDIMEARAVANKTKKQSRTEINAIISKKISNLTSYDGNI